MGENIDLICPTRQGQQRATNWLDGQFAHERAAGNARRAEEATLTHIARILEDHLSHRWTEMIAPSTA
ncbi:hypothetical protein BRAS3809_5330001 [Bradyrhizobium sp. STM 3809]|nr:hypothetical protein BRAS3809_5330001 [Bradyrhizobium sp. STM 3809]